MSIIRSSSEMTGQESCHCTGDTSEPQWGGHSLGGINICIEKPFTLAWSRSNVHGMSKPRDNLEIWGDGQQPFRLSVFYSTYFISFRSSICFLFPWNLSTSHVGRYSYTVIFTVNACSQSAICKHSHAFPLIFTLTHFYNALHLLVLKAPPCLLFYFILMTLFKTSKCKALLKHVSVFFWGNWKDISEREKWVY